ncbi:MAG: ABC transporter permease subunit [Solirubrobacteraceae bacterium]|nr:ABC transporter permease subunit [Solirubrobacteraceae bacterium]
MTAFPVTLRSEWTKLASLRGTWIKVALALVLAVGMSALIAIVIGATWNDASAADRAAFDPARDALFGGIFSAIVFVVLGATAATSEYTSGMIRLTLTATPRRGRVLAAKAAVVAAITLAAGLLANATMFLVAQAIFGSYGLQTASLTDGDALRIVVADGLLAPVLALIALALGFALRSTAGAVTSVLGLIFLPGIFGTLLPAWWQDNVLDYLPGAAAEAITSGHLEGATATMAPALALVVLAGWLTVFLGGALAALQTRDA